MMTSEEWNDKTTGAYLDALVQWMQKLGRDMDLHASEEWDEHENVFAAVNAITDLRAQHAAQAAEIARLTAERDRFEAALGRACLVGGTTYLLERAEKAEAERDAALAGAVKVKPLVWELEPDRPAEDPYWIARPNEQKRHVVLKAWCEALNRWEFVWDIFCETEELAKTAAQADYDARILAAIQPDPDARHAALVKAFCMGRDAAAEARGKVKGLRGAAAIAWALEDGDRWTRSAAQNAILARAEQIEGGAK